MIVEKELILIKQMHQKSVIFLIDYNFLDKDFKYESYLFNGCHDLMQKTMTFNDIAIVSVKISDYRIYFEYMGKDNAINIIKNSDLEFILGIWAKMML